MRLKQCFSEDALQWFIFCVCCMGLGVLSAYNIGGWSFIAVVFAIFNIRPLRLPIIFFIMGVSSMTFRMQALKGIVIEKFERAEISGQVDSTFLKNGSLRAIMSDIKCEKCKHSLPRKLIASFQQDENIEEGAVIEIKGFLLPLPLKVFPYFYDIEIKSRFRGIGGYISVKEWKILKQNFSVKGYIKNYARKVFSKTSDKRSEGVALALFLGEKGTLSKEEYNAFKNAGLAHMLAISGLHMSIFCLFLFGVFYSLLALTPVCKLCDTKKIAAVLGLVMGFLYLVIAGFPISGIRSFFMMAFLFGGIIFGRGATGTRSLFLAIFFIMVCWPEEILFPSLQLSFISVLCLLTAFSIKNQTAGFLNKAMKTALNTSIASFCVSFLTAPFAIHHFSFINFYGIFSNVVAIPLLCIIIMPLLLICVITGSAFFLKFFEISVKALFQIASFFSSLPFSAIFLPHLNGILLLIFTFGLIFFLCFKNVFKISGVIIIFLSCLIYGFTARLPDIIVNSEYLLIKEKKKYISVFYIPEGFLKEVWKEKLQLPFIPYNGASTYSFICQDGACFSDSRKFTIIYENDASSFPCLEGLLINMTDNVKNSCNYKKAVTFYEIKKKGTFLFNL